MRDGWREEELKKGAGVDMKCEVLPSAISEYVLELGAVLSISDCTEQWSESGKLMLELGFKSDSAASVEFHKDFSCPIWSSTEIDESSWWQKFDKNVHYNRTFTANAKIQCQCRKQCAIYAVRQ